MHLIRHPELFEIKTLSEVIGVATKCKFSQTVVKKNEGPSSSWFGQSIKLLTANLCDQL